MDDNGLSYIARAIGLSNPTPQQLAAALRAKEMTHTPLPPLESLKGHDPLTDWALGFRQRTLHPLEAMANYSQEFQNMTPEEQGMQLVGGGINNIGGLLAHTAWHGSPHLFDKFKSAAIGTGEGAQAYGHGLYLAEHPEVATGYQKNLSDAVNEFKIQDNAKKMAIDNHIAPVLNNYGSDVTKSRLPIIAQRMIGNNTSLAEELASLQLKAANASNPKQYQKDIQAISEGGNAFSDALNEARKTFNDHVENYQGYLYKTDIPDAHIDKMLDWDKPLSEQPYALKALQDAGYGRTDTPGVTGAYFAPKTPQEAMALHAAGIPGIKYLDSSSRTAGEGTRNFVMFNPDDIRILERNGQPTGLQPWDINK